MILTKGDQDHEEQHDAAEDRGGVAAERVLEPQPGRRDGFGRLDGRVHVSSGCAGRTACN